MAAAPSIHIVLVEDDSDYAMLVEEQLRAAWPGPLTLRHAVRLADARALIASGAACVLLDLSLPDAAGLDGLAEALELAGPAPVVVLTGQGDEDGLAAAALRLGAQDYLVKSRTTGEVIVRSVRYAMERRGAELDRHALEEDYAREARVAEELQRGLIRPLPAIPGLDVAARYEPSGDAGRVGGDWYDVLVLPDGRVGLAMGDVAGHGLPAAALMGDLSSALRSAALADPEPSAVLVSVDAYLRQYFAGDIATLVFGLLEPSAPEGEAGLTASIGSAGHPPVLVLRADGATEWVKGGQRALLGAPPGVADAAPAELAVGPGDTLVLYTDGLVERRGESLDVGFARLADAAAGAAQLSPSALADRLLSALVPGGGGGDDVAVLVVRCAPGA